MSLHQTHKSLKAGRCREVARCLSSLLRGPGGFHDPELLEAICQMSGWSRVRSQERKDENGPEGEARSSKWGTTQWTNVLQTFSEPLAGHTVTRAGDSGDPL